MLYPDMANSSVSCSAMIVKMPVQNSKDLTCNSDPGEPDEDSVDCRLQCTRLEEGKILMNESRNHVSSIMDLTVALKKR
jgi:hypothetical protein